MHVSAAQLDARSRKLYNICVRQGKEHRYYKTSGVEPEMQVRGAMVVSWIIQCSEAESR
jgi:hypothetical protein